MRYLLILSCIIAITVHGWAQQQRGFVPVNDGKLYYETDGSGPPLVFLHGVCLDHRMWQPQIAYFSKSYTCINIDLRGFGASSVPGSMPFSFHEDIKTVLDSLHIEEPVILIALSMGGRGAINFALAYPERTRALVVSDIVVDGYTFRDFDLGRIAKIAQQEGIDKANQAFLEMQPFATAKRDSAVFDRLRQMALSYSGWIWVHKNPIHGLTPPAIEQLGEIHVPVLVMTGEKDIWDFQQVADILHKHIKGSIRKMVPDAGHMCNMEKPEVFNQIVSAFLHSHKVAVARQPEGK